MTDTLMLASASPRRRRLLALLGVDYDCTAVDVPEDVPVGGVDPVALAVTLAVDKGLAARAAFGDERPILAADTIVVHGGEVLGKPADEDDAVRMLTALSGGTHQVVTAVALLEGGAAPVVEAVVSDVLMAELGDDAIASWVAGDECLGCAGAYNIEGHLAEVAMDECFQSVAGLPLCHVHGMLAALADTPEGLASPVAACDAALGRTCALGPRLLD